MAAVEATRVCEFSVKKRKKDLSYDLNDLPPNVAAYRWFSRYVIDAILVDESKRSSFVNESGYLIVFLLHLNCFFQIIESGVPVNYLDS